MRTSASVPAAEHFAAIYALNLKVKVFYALARIYVAIRKLIATYMAVNSHVCKVGCGRA